VLRLKLEKIEMRVYVFRGRGRVFGFIPDDASINLPAAYGPWIGFKSFDLKWGDVNGNFDVNECLDDIAKYGFHLTDAHVRITEQAAGYHRTKSLKT
jgi:hypothetical protein